MQELDEKRIQKIQSSMKQMSDIEKSIQPIINTCLEGVTQASQKIDHSEVSVVRNKVEGQGIHDYLNIQSLEIVGNNIQTNSYLSIASWRTNDAEIEKVLGVIQGTDLHVIRIVWCCGYKITAAALAVINTE